MTSMMQDTVLGQNSNDVTELVVESTLPVSRNVPGSPLANASDLNQDEDVQAGTGITNPMSTGTSNYATDSTGRTCQCVGLFHAHGE
jgi:hypothetical protein